ncbi:MAG: hypothetical protein KDK37_14590, partial [Leptospiraceae bacterium]|nr:hypothetical protein [Leptospiraceae bacterium]
MARKSIMTNRKTTRAKSAKKKTPKAPAPRARAKVKKASRLAVKVEVRKAPRREIPNVENSGKDSRGWYVREMEKLRWKEKMYASNDVRDRLESLFDSNFPPEDIQIVIRKRCAGGHI